MFTLSLPTIVTLFLSSFAAVRASPCVAFDTNWNLLAFGLDGKDWNAGTQGTWASGASFFRSHPFVYALKTFYLLSGPGNLQAPLPISPPLVVREFCLVTESILALLITGLHLQTF